MDGENVVYLTPVEVAARMRVSTDTVFRLLRSGRLNGRKFGKQWRIDRRDLDAYLKSNGATVSTPRS
jgi:excisionase family DNA binding protein